jgi:hypothetical protein
MSLHFISGKPGGGKSLYGVRLVIDEIVNGSRPIVTNLSLRLPELCEYVQLHFPVAYARRFIIPRRHFSDDFVLIDDEQMAQFFTIRGNGVRLKGVSNEEWAKGVLPDYKPVNDSGVFYVLDEVHIAFNARQWVSTGKEVLYYLSQHRKLGDDVIAITQNVGNVDKQFRSMAQDYTYLKNLSKQRAGMFNLPAIFHWASYSSPATATSKAEVRGSFKLDVKGFASLYDTAKGVGIHGRAGADKHHRKKGVHWIFMLVGIPLLAWGLIHFAPKVLFYLMGGHHTAISVPARPETSVKPAARLSPASLEASSLSSADISPGLEARSPETFFAGKAVPVWCTGFFLTTAGAQVTLSDGSFFDSRDGDVQQVTRKTVTVGGHVFPVHRIRDSELVHIEPEELQKAGQNPAPATHSDRIRPNTKFPVGVAGDNEPQTQAEELRAFSALTSATQNQ